MEAPETRAIKSPKEKRCFAGQWTAQAAIVCHTGARRKNSKRAFRIFERDDRTRATARAALVADNWVSSMKSLASCDTRHSSRRTGEVTTGMITGISCPRPTRPAKQGIRTHTLANVAATHAHIHLTRARGADNSVSFSMPWSNLILRRKLTIISLQEINGRRRSAGLVGRLNITSNVDTGSFPVTVTTSREVAYIPLALLFADTHTRTHLYIDVGDRVGQGPHRTGTLF